MDVAKPYQFASGRSCSHVGGGDAKPERGGAAGTGHEVGASRPSTIVLAGPPSGGCGFDDEDAPPLSEVGGEPEWGWAECPRSVEGEWPFPDAGG